jgi:colicin import membrane protein
MISAPSVQRLLSSDSMLASDDFNLGFFDDESSNSIHVLNADAWQTASASALALKADQFTLLSTEDLLGEADAHAQHAQMHTHVSAEPGDKGQGQGQGHSDVWRSAIAEQESVRARERLLRDQRELQQEQLRKLREESVQSSLDRLEREKQAEEEAARRERDKEDEQRKLAQERERERRAREETAQTVDLDSQRDVFDM